MKIINFDIEEHTSTKSKTVKDYTLLIRTNLLPIIFISLVITSIAIIYALFTENIYKSTVIIKITTQSKDILASTELQDLVRGSDNDRFIANEIQVMNSYDTREKVALALVDSFNNSKDKNLFKILRSGKDKQFSKPKSLQDIAEIIMDAVSVEQIGGVDVVEISALSQSPYEAALIANTFAYQYIQLNLLVNRNQLTNVRTFLEKQRLEKLNELNKAEDTLKIFQEKGGIVSLDAQSTALINQLAQLDAQRDATTIDLMSSNEVLNQYKDEVKKQDPQLVKYLENQTSQTYIEILQQKIAELQTSMDLAMTNKNSTMDVSSKMKEFDIRITDLKEKLNVLINDIKADAYATSPDQIKDLTQKLIEEEIKNNSLSIKLKELQTIIYEYEKDFNRLPRKSIQLAQLQRKKESYQQLFLLIDEKYQEIMINELSQPGNAVIIGIGRIPNRPAKPNRLMIAFIGIIAGLGIALGYILIKDYFDDKVKTPEDIAKNKIKFIGWVPHIINENPDSNTSEAFKSIKARLQFSRVGASTLKTILITSPAEQEGKTVISTNLARAFAKTTNKTLLVDGDLRRPRIHSIMEVEKTPGIVDYLCNEVKLEKIIRNSKMDCLSYVTSGTIPPDPAEVLESIEMKNFLEEMKNRFDIIIIDSAPIRAVVDSEILSRIVDGTILVICADRTEIKLMTDAVNLIRIDKAPFLGTVLNNFKYKSGYGYYYKYYYNYTSSNEKANRKNKM